MRSGSFLEEDDFKCLRSNGEADSAKGERID